MKKLVLFSILSFFVISITGLLLVWNNFINTPGSSVNQELVYEIVPGLTFRAVARDLQKRGFISNSNFFIILAKIQGGANRMKVGEYALNRNMSPREILSVILSGKSIERSLTISEGLNIFEVAELFESAGLAKKDVVFKTLTDKAFVKSLLGEDHDSLEGYLFPETYDFTKYTDYKVLIGEMVSKFKNTFKEIGAASKVKGLSRHEIVTLASIIEKETGAPDERPLISSIFHNRLNKHMLLQTDPTIIYGKAISEGNLEIKISRSDLTKRTPYNTYVIKGLPPGPIANPGKASLLAAVQPAPTNYLYFVSHNDGTHQFSEDYKSHLRAVKKYQLDPRAREGKSWRDLNKHLEH
jgi:UPF0755 protein